MRSPLPASRWSHAAYLVACSLTCILWSWWAGRDLNWDQLNYHLYVPFQFLAGRLEQDFLAAGVTSYLNPIAYVPFYLMVRAHWPSLLIGSTMALLHSACLWLAYGISLELVPAGTRARPALLAASLLLSTLVPVFLIEVGSSFIDITSAIPALAGILLLLRLPRLERTTASSLLGGTLLGMAVGLKLTNAVFAVAASALIVFHQRVWQWKARSLVELAVGGVAGVLLTEGAWAYRLYRAFGNPLFPWYNGWFRSPDFDPINIEPSRTRFAPENLSDVITLPVRLLDQTGHAYSETMSPDARFLAAYALLAIASVVAWRRWRLPAAANAPHAMRTTPAFIPALAFTATSYALWLATSGNGRYGLVLSVFLGPMLVAGALAVIRSPRALAYSLIGLVLVQGTLTVVGADKRWLPVPWKHEWYDLRIPAELRAKPYLYLSLQTESYSFVAPFLHPDSAYINLAGAYSLDPNGPGGHRLRTLIQRHSPAVRTLYALDLAGRTLPVEPKERAAQDSLLARLDLRIDAASCLLIEVHDPISTPTILMSLWTSRPGTVANSLPAMLMSCGTIPADPGRADAALALELKRANAAFDVIEARCPQQFSPRAPYTDRYGSALRRVYINSDTAIIELRGSVSYAGLRGGISKLVGALDDVIAGRVTVDCDVLRHDLRYQHF